MRIRGMSTDSYLEKIREFHGHLAPGMVCGGFMVELAFRSLPEGGLYDAIAETRACLPDAIQVLTPCTIGNGWLRIVNTGRFAIILYDKYTGQGVRVSLDPDRLESWPETRIWAMKLKPKKEQDKKRLFGEIIEAGPGLYKIERVTVDKSGFAGKGKIFTCSRCGESYRGSDAGTCDACKGLVPFSPAGEDRVHIESVPVESAVDKQVLHDMTRIETGVSKGPAFHQGDTLKAQDVSLLKSMGKEHIHVMENRPDGAELMHENDVAPLFAERMAGDGVVFDPAPREGRIDLKADRDGVLCVDTERLVRFNRCRGVMCATRRGYLPVTAGMTIAGTRAVPLYLPVSRFEEAMAVLSGEPLLRVAPYRLRNMGILVTGTEVAEGRVQDRFTPIMEACAGKYGLTVTGRRVVPDDRNAVADSAAEFIEKGAEILVVTGGLSVDPDDLTRSALLQAGMVDDVYGAPVLPGAMTLVGRIGNTRIIGVPAGAIYFDETAFDLLFPRLLADLPLTRADMAALAEGGLLEPQCRQL